MSVVSFNSAIRIPVRKADGIKNVQDAPGVLFLGVPGVPWHTQILADKLTLSNPGGANYTHHINTGTPRFSDLLPTALCSVDVGYLEARIHFRSKKKRLKKLSISKAAQSMTNFRIL